MSQLIVHVWMEFPFKKVVLILLILASHPLAPGTCQCVTASFLRHMCCKVAEGRINICSAMSSLWETQQRAERINPFLPAGGQRLDYPWRLLRGHRKGLDLLFCLLILGHRKD